MRRVLSSGEFNALARGELSGLDGRTYNRRTTRMNRKDAAAMVDAGRPVVIYGEGGELVWLDGHDTASAWAQIRDVLTADAPDHRRGESVTGGRWESLDGGELLVLLRHH